MDATPAADTVAPAEATDAAAPVAAPANAAIPRLCSGMSHSDLEMYLKRYKSASGVTLFINANFTRLEHYSWAVLSDLSGSVSKWQHARRR